MKNVQLEYKKIQNLLKYNRKDLSKEDVEMLELTKNIYGFKDADILSNMIY